MNIPAKNPKIGFTVKAHQGDARTLLAFDLPKVRVKNLAGFTIHAAPQGKAGDYLLNALRFEKPEDHAQVKSELPNSSVNAPFHKFRWLHVPGASSPFGSWTYTVTPRYFNDKQSMLPLDPSLSAVVTIELKPFAKGKLELGFTRGFVQSQAYVHRFGKKAVFQPKGNELLFDTAQISGKNEQGKSYTFADQYEWLGFTARDKILGLLTEVVQDKALKLDVFAYDLNEPDVMKALLSLAKEGRVRVILDNATLHHSVAKPKREDQFELLFQQAAKNGAAIQRGRFGRFAHDKIFIVSRKNVAEKVLTGSTNFSITGLYVNSNHVLVFNDATVADKYAQVFQTVWDGALKGNSFAKTTLAKVAFSAAVAGVPPMDITFSPHDDGVAQKILGDMAKRIETEGKRAGGSVLFAVMGLDKKGTGPVLPALRQINSNQDIFSYGITDTTDGIQLYTRRSKRGVLVTGKQGSTKLPPPFSQVPGLRLEHQVHHKFIVCGFNTKDAVVYCGSSNLALEGEKANGDNLIAIRDPDVATVFAIEAVGLVDHFEFLDRHRANAKKNKVSVPKTPEASKVKMADKAGWHLSTDDAWATPYYDPEDLHSVDRELFG